MDRSVELEPQSCGRKICSGICFRKVVVVVVVVVVVEEEEEEVAVELELKVKVNAQVKVEVKGKVKGKGTEKGKGQGQGKGQGKVKGQVKGKGQGKVWKSKRTSKRKIARGDGGKYKCHHLHNCNLEHSWGGTLSESLEKPCFERIVIRDWWFLKPDDFGFWCKRKSDEKER